MSRNEDIDNAIWDDPDFERLSKNATLLYLWSWTNTRCAMSGMYKVSHQGMTQCKVALEDIPATLDELAAARFVFYEDDVLWVRARVKRLRSRSPQMAKAIRNDLRKLPDDHPLKAKFRDEYGEWPWLRDTISEAYTEPIVNLSEKPIGKGEKHTLSGTSSEVPGQGQGEGEGNTPSKKVQLPDDFPRELRPHLTSVYRVLRSLAERHNAKAVKPLPLASVVMGRPHKPLVAAAFDCASYWDDQPTALKDVVAAYRRWLDKAPDLAGYERLGVDGMPSGQRIGAAKGNAAQMLRDINATPDTEPDFVDAEVVEEDAA